MSVDLEQHRERILARAKRAGQEHVLAFWERLDTEGRKRLLAQLEELDWHLVEELAHSLRQPEAPSASNFEPCQVFGLQRDANAKERAELAREAGRELLRQGRVGYVLVAGGQASRLGCAGPKGAFAIGPVSGRSLFEFHARRLRAASARHGGVRVPWYVMTSPQNDQETRAFFAANEFFGLQLDDVFFFSQATLPALDDQGRILLSAPDALFLAPNGHGGVLAGLSTSGALADMRTRGIETLSYFQVDNPLAPPADELFLGLHTLEEAEMSSKVVSKRNASEKVGVLGRINGRIGCIEYSDLGPSLGEARDAHGQLVFRAGNIAMHALQVAFVERLTKHGLALPWHRARKQVACVNQHGDRCERMGVKFEAFVFDALGEARHSITLEVERALEFSPVKNASGEDSPHSTRQDLTRLHAGWVRNSGLPLPAQRADGLLPVEVDPLFAEDDFEFLARAHKKHPRSTEQGHLYEIED